MIKLFVPLKVFPRRRHIFPLLKPFEKGAGFKDSDRIQAYGISEEEITFVDSIEASHYVILPMSWNFYKTNNSLKEVEDIINKAAKANRTVLSFMVGDFGIKIKEYPNVLIFRNSGDSRSLSSNHIGLPVFIEDPLQKIFRSVKVSTRSYQSKPVIGFCGQADASIFNASKEIGKTFIRNAYFILKLSNSPSQKLMSTTYLRASLLQTLERSENIVTNFIYRKKYRAGVTNPEMRKRTTHEFYENMQNSDYVLCVRGAGNFSVRFYETLAMGRIPVFVDTNCLLPLSDLIDWKKHIVWVAYHERHLIAAKINEFHSKLTADTFAKIQTDNRELWSNSLQLSGFFKKFMSAESDTR